MNGAAKRTVMKLLAVCLVTLTPLGAVAQNGPYSPRNMPRSSDGQNFGGQQTQRQSSDDWRRQQDEAKARQNEDQQKWQQRDDEWRGKRDEQSRQEQSGEPRALPSDGSAPR